MKTQRMINTQITTNDDFMELPITSQYLYYRLIENADNEGFIDNVKLLIRGYGCKMSDIENLVKANFLITLDKKVYAIKHWNILQRQRFERISASKYDLRNHLYIKENGSYTLKEEGIKYTLFVDVIKSNIKNNPKEKNIYYYTYVSNILNNNKQITNNNNQISNTNTLQCNAVEDDTYNIF